MAIENDIADDRPKVYRATSFMFCLTGRETTDQKIAQTSLLPLDAKVDVIAQKLLDGCAVPKNEVTDAQHIAISEAAMKFALDCGSKPAEVSANPNFHCPRASAAVV